MSTPPTLVLHRMVLPDHTCPFGLRAKLLLEQSGLDFTDHILSSREEVEAFKSEHNVATTPLVLADDQPIGGSEALERYLAEQGASV